ncbi:hypothetical protein BDQ17DRAFT_1326073 [Cyathus striatus]|nr:hypothetical protein BDQ17DRAFT_1326073 [Cyathus striatus]
MLEALRGVLRGFLLVGSRSATADVSPFSRRHFMCEEVIANLKKDCAHRYQYASSCVCNTPFKPISITGRSDAWRDLISHPTTTLRSRVTLFLLALEGVFVFVGEEVADSLIEAIGCRYGNFNLNLRENNFLSTYFLAPFFNRSILSKNARRLLLWAFFCGHICEEMGNSFVGAVSGEVAAIKQRAVDVIAEASPVLVAEEAAGGTSANLTGYTEMPLR